MNMKTVASCGKLLLYSDYFSPWKFPCSAVSDSVFQYVEHSITFKKRELKMFTLFHILSDMIKYSPVK